jgi:Uma2 family endonuclease
MMGRFPKEDAGMVTVIEESWQLSIPDYVTDIHGYRRWTDAEDFPEIGRIWWLKGEVWADMSGEQIFTHVLVKTEFTVVLGSLSQKEELGVYFTDGVLLSNFAADISGKPDGLFLADDTFTSDRIRLIEGKEHGYTELQGSPDMVLEVLSDGSEKKDEVVLMTAYREAGVREYWLVDVRGEKTRLDIFRYGPKGYTAARKKDGWVKSNVFGKSFRLLARQSRTKHPDYKLEVR